jgi:hypothetical protein
LKSQTLQTCLHTTAFFLALSTLVVSFFISHRGIQRHREEPVAQPPGAEASNEVQQHAEPAPEPSLVRKSLLEIRARSLAQVEPRTQLQNRLQEIGSSDRHDSSLAEGPSVRFAEKVSPVSPSLVETVRPLGQSEILEQLSPRRSEGPQWLKGDGFIVGWDGNRCITAGQLDDPTELTLALASVPTISRRALKDVALVNYNEARRSEESYEDNDLWESDQDTTSPGDGGGGGGGGEKQSGAIGVPPPRPQPQFLRDTSVLLDPGEYQFEYGFSYTTNSQTTAIGLNLNSNTVVTSLRTLTRTATVPVELRFGCRNDTQTFVSLPFGYNLQQISVANTADSSDGIGIGDFSFGCTRVLRKPQPEKFTILGSLTASAPTGLAQLSNIQQVPGVALGSGYWTLSSGVVFIRTIDPIAAFVGLNYTNTFETMLENLDLQPGNIFSYRFGIGYAINSRVTISSSFNGAYVSELEVGGRLIPGSAREPLTVRLAATILSKGPSLVGSSKGKRKTTEPFITMGVTDAAPDTSFGLRWTY